MNLLFEAKYALRKLKQAPVFSVTSTLIVAVSIAIALFVFAIVYRYSMQPLAFPGADRWFIVQEYNIQSRGFNPYSIDPYRFARLKQESLPGAELIGGYSVQTAVHSDGETSNLVAAMFIDPTLLQATQVRPLKGRIFRLEDAEQTSTSVVMLDYNVWQNYYGADETIVGQQTRIDGRLRTVAGVLPKGFSLDFAAEFYLPLPVTNPTHPIEGVGVFPVYKLQPNANLALLNQQLSQIDQSIKAEYPNDYSNHQDDWQFVPIHKAFMNNAQGFFTVMALVAAILPLLGAFNIGILSSAKLSERTQELAIRNAIGGTYWRQLRQTLLESGMPLITGWVLGLVLALIVFYIFNPVLAANVNAAGSRFPDRWLLRLESADIIFSLLVTLFIWLGCSLGPSLNALKQNIAMLLAQGSKGSTKSSSFKTASALVGFQTVIACFLLIISLTLVAKMQFVVNPNLGFDIKPHVTGIINMELDKDGDYSQLSNRLDYLDRLKQELTDLPSVNAAAFTSGLPGEPRVRSEYQVEDQAVSSDNYYPQASIAHISENYFDVIGVEILHGRSFDTNDNAESQAVVIVDENFAKQY